MSALRSPPRTYFDDSFALAVVRVDSSRASLRAAGEMDLAAVEPLTRLLVAQRMAGRVYIRLDLSAVTFIDCACLGVLVRVHESLLAAGGQLILTSVAEPVTRLLSLTGLDGHLLTTTGRILVGTGDRP